MEEQIHTRVRPEDVWRAWERAHEQGIQEGKKGKHQFRYQIINVKRGESFSILWKSLFVRLVFSHSVKPTNRGSSIAYQVQIKGFLSWPVRWFVKEKIRKNISAVLKSFVNELENQSVV